MDQPIEAIAAPVSALEPLVFRSMDRRCMNRRTVERGSTDRRGSYPGGSSEVLAAFEGPDDQLLSAPAPPAPEIDLLQVQQSAHEQGLREGMARAEAQFSECVAQERQGVVHALEGFVREKQRYFAGLEKEVVRLSLAIAERVLHRESAMDPTLLAGAARVALQQVEDDSTARLRTSAEEAAMWEEILSREGRAVKVCVDAALTRGQCLLEAANGTVELGIRSQLQEIEHGFFELLGRNPHVSMQGT